jgi:molybdopterin/thiamine biosynthesis adenylyltransferase
MSADDMFMRNIGLVTKEEQEIISKTKVGVAGCGMGSEVARQLTRFGFSISALADPDTVEHHNLNRQSYHQTHVGKKKVEALLEKIQLINPELKPKLFLDGITRSNYKEFVDLSDIVVDAIDPAFISMSVVLTRESLRNKKPVVTAIDFGFGARLFVFSPEGPDILDFMGLDKNLSDTEIQKIPIEKAMKSYIENIPNYSMDVILKTTQGELPYYPQNMLAVGQAAVLITSACKRLALGQKVTTVPQYVHIDPDLLVSGSK